MIIYNRAALLLGLVLFAAVGALLTFAAKRVRRLWEQIHARPRPSFPFLIAPLMTWLEGHPRLHILLLRATGVFALLVATLFLLVLLLGRPAPAS